MDAIVLPQRAFVASVSSSQVECKKCGATKGWQYLILNTPHRTYHIKPTDILQVNTILILSELHIWGSTYCIRLKKISKMLQLLQEMTPLLIVLSALGYYIIQASCITRPDPVYPCLDSSSMVQGSLRMPSQFC